MKAARIRDLMARVERDRRLINEHYLPVEKMTRAPAGMPGKRYRGIVKKIARNEREIERLMLAGITRKSSCHQPKRKLVK